MPMSSPLLHLRHFQTRHWFTSYVASLPAWLLGATAQPCEKLLQRNCSLWTWSRCSPCGMVRVEFPWRNKGIIAALRAIAPAHLRKGRYLGVGPIGEGSYNLTKRWVSIGPELGTGKVQDFKGARRPTDLGCRPCHTCDGLLVTFHS